MADIFRRYGEAFRQAHAGHLGDEVADIAVMLNGILDSGKIFRLATMLRNGPPEATLDLLADALDEELYQASRNVLRWLPTCHHPHRDGAAQGFRRRDNQPTTRIRRHLDLPLAVQVIAVMPAHETIFTAAAGDCKTVYPGSIPGVASNKIKDLAPEPNGPENRVSVTSVLATGAHTDLVSM